jgi:hypothetical protein
MHVVKLQEEGAALKRAIHDFAQNTGALNEYTVGPAQLDLNGTWYVSTFLCPVSESRDYYVGKPLLLTFNVSDLMGGLPEPPEGVRVIRFPTQRVAVVPHPTNASVYDTLLELREAWPGWGGLIHANLASAEAVEFLELASESEVDGDGPWMPLRCQLNDFMSPNGPADLLLLQSMGLGLNYNNGRPSHSHIAKCHRPV